MTELKNQPNTSMTLAGVIITPLVRYLDPRGWLVEAWRSDELAPEWHPAMGYVSLTHAGVVRGPHEHVDQADLFVFLSGEFKLHLWDKVGGKMVLDVGEAHPCSVLVPPGVVHAYQNVGLSDALVLNFPNRLYRGPGRSEPVDEVRHEDDPSGRFEL